MNILECNLFDGQPYIAEKDGKYHVMQGTMTADDVKKWHDTENEAVERWNSRVRAACEYEKSRMGIPRDISKDYDYMKNLIGD